IVSTVHCTLTVPITINTLSLHDALPISTVAYVQDDLHRCPDDCNINRSVELHYAKINDHLGFCYPLELNYDQHIVRMPLFSPNLSPSLRVLALPSYPLHLGSGFDQFVTQFLYQGSFCRKRDDP